MESFPEHQWKDYLFAGLPSGYWSELSHRKKALSDVAKALNIKYWEDWYNVTGEEVDSALGKNLVAEYSGGSLPTVLKDTFPEYPWLLWKFRNLPKGTWGSEETCKQALEWAAKQLGLKELQEW